MKYYWLVTFGVALYFTMGMIIIAAKFDNLFVIFALDVLWGTVCIVVGKWFLKIEKGLK